MAQAPVARQAAVTATSSHQTLAEAGPTVGVTGSAPRHCAPRITLAALASSRVTGTESKEAITALLAASASHVFFAATLARDQS